MVITKFTTLIALLAIFIVIGLCIPYVFLWVFKFTKKDSKRKETWFQKYTVYTIFGAAVAEILLFLFVMFTNSFLAAFCVLSVQVLAVVTILTVPIVLILVIQTLIALFGCLITEVFPHNFREVHRFLNESFANVLKKQEKEKAKK